ncbi:hypothetical protein [Clostridium sp.]|uniref:hypothetical protein n=1 Tax=Clostridium sp. TaxID=1506 RepID=UPI002FCAB53F
MEEKIYKKAIDLVFDPEGFKDLRNLNDNIVAYGELEQLHGRYIGKLNKLGNLCNEEDDSRGLIELKEELKKHFSKDSTEELSLSLKTWLVGLLIVLVHNDNKKNNKYGINIS